MSNHPDLTKNQSLVFSALRDAEGPLSAYTILDHLRSRGFRAPLQVYRALEKLMAHGMVHRIESLNAFVACAHDHPHMGESIAFAICQSCGGVTEFSDKVLKDHLVRWCLLNQFTAHTTTLEMRGLCSDCGGKDQQSTN